ncbi:hypothetical protein A2159_00050 [Candidatus Woesebacteria bacterium RBG_13_34_9]|uniref:Uncharacterized protein n=1 Tax=Candidatus Woesebacteria bacterium RBG_13_34_9 TaxID=1802477 RepID=A0A1F7X3H7_9BACT|nr:MAG: hypothetical protein A2159_00050 [Candidatus Woesebacteria bacterium RBG_13_34_9]
MQDDNQNTTQKNSNDQDMNQVAFGLSATTGEGQTISESIPPNPSNQQTSDPSYDNQNPTTQTSNTSQEDKANPESTTQTSQNIQNIVSSPHTPKKYGGNKVIATIFGFILLIAGIGAGVFLVQRQVRLNQEASSGAECSHSPDCILLESPGNSGEYNSPRTISKVNVTAQESHEYNPGDTNDGCYHVVINGRYLSWNRVGSGPECKDISNVQIWLSGETVSNTPTTTPSITPPACKYCDGAQCKTRTEICNSGINECQTNTNCGEVTNTPSVTPKLTTTEGPLSPTSPPSISAECLEVKAYDNSWNQISLQELSELTAGDVVRFAVSGNTSSGSFDKARFSVNNTSIGETTIKKPGTNEFYKEYTIPSNTNSFSVKGEIHHTTLGWI